jgi:hypothetical protein
MSNRADKADRYGNQLIEVTVKKAAIEASLHAAQMLLLDIVALLEDLRDRGEEPIANLLTLETFEKRTREYLMTSAWVLPPDDKLLDSLSLSGSPEEVAPSQGEGDGATSDGSAA